MFATADAGATSTGATSAVMRTSGADGLLPSERET